MVMRWFDMGSSSLQKSRSSELSILILNSQHEQNIIVRYHGCSFLSVGQSIFRYGVRSVL